MWNTERIEAVKALWIGGLSAAEIANKVGGVTRNAVLGKLHRLGLTRRENPQRGGGPTVTRRYASFRAQSTRHGVRKAEKLKPISFSDPQPIIEDVSETPARRLLDLELYECRWPIGDPRTPEFGFCGCKAAKPYGYCERHQAKAYARVA